MTNRSQRRTIANETVEICTRGNYIVEGREVDIEQSVQRAVAATIHYPSAGFEPVLQQRDVRLAEHRFASTEYGLSNGTTLAAASRLLQHRGHVACLNFSSAKHPGGGFLGGSRAQEESLARASALYACIAPCREHYQEGRRSADCFYTDSMLFSPHVPVFRDDQDGLIAEPYEVSFITAAAVNQQGFSRPDEARTEQVMLRRMERLLAVAIVNGCDTLVLGAWGCGVFRNDPARVAGWFHDRLIDDAHLRGAFARVHFAVLDGTESRVVYDAFNARFGAVGTVGTV